MQIAMPLQRTERPDRVREVADLIRQGLSQAEIASRLGITPGRFGQIRVIHGLPMPRTAAKIRRPRRELTERQVRILEFVRDFTTRNPYPPTVREIAAGCDISSTSVASYQLGHLREKGYLTRVPGIARGIALTERGRSRAAH